MPEEQSPELVGWAVMHQYFRIDRARWLAATGDFRRDAIAEYTDRLRQLNGEEGLQFVPLAGIAKSDVGFMAVHPDLRRMQQLGQQLAATKLGTCLTPVYSFLSMSEVSSSFPLFFPFPMYKSLDKLQHLVLLSEWRRNH
jgi:chlorite dismutase